MILVRVRDGPVPDDGVEQAAGIPKKVFTLSERQIIVLTKLRTFGLSKARYDLALS
jgi:hypothetical protein